MKNCNWPPRAQALKSDAQLLRKLRLFSMAQVWMTMAVAQQQNKAPSNGNPVSEEIALATRVNKAKAGLSNAVLPGMPDKTKGGGQAADLAAGARITTGSGQVTGMPLYRINSDRARGRSGLPVTVRAVADRNTTAAVGYR